MFLSIVFSKEIDYLVQNSLMEFVDDDTFMLTDYGAHHIYGIIPLFYSHRARLEMFDMANRILKPERGEQIFLEKYDRKQFDAPSVAVDLIVLSPDAKSILLITRGAHPFANSLALPGGFYKQDDDSVEACAIRELEEETGIRVPIDDLKLVKISSGKNRDPRGWIISIAYVIRLGEKAAPMANSDAILAKWYPLDTLDSNTLAFDHKAILQAALSML